MIRPRIVLITDPAFGDEVTVRCVRAAARALPPGCLCVQLRDKRRARVSLRLFAWQLRRVTKEVGSFLVINGDARLACDVGADGVHLGGGAGTPAEARTLLRHGWVSTAAHDDDAVERAVRGGADAVLVGAIFPTRSASSTGEEKRARGIAALGSARKASQGKLAVYALGGINVENAASCAVAGADGVAVVRALLESADPARTARRLHDVVVRRW
jgi:thiamine-phosphate diphosphorylase